MTVLPPGSIEVAPIEATRLGGSKVVSKAEEAGGITGRWGGRGNSPRSNNSHRGCSRNFTTNSFAKSSTTPRWPRSSGCRCVGRCFCCAALLLAFERSTHIDAALLASSVSHLGRTGTGRNGLSTCSATSASTAPPSSGSKNGTPASSKAPQKRLLRSSGSGRGVRRGRGRGLPEREGQREGLRRQHAPDPYGLPQEKILLLPDPPGLGKTDLAHVLPGQAGYQVLEIDTSDDRTSRIVDERIRNAVYLQALMTVRPTCVVVDEIDGAGDGGGPSFVKTLVKLVTEGSSLKKPSRKGKGKQQRPLLRPIICICNDLYAPALRPLRPLAKIIRFNPPTAPMLIKRLRTICDVEGLSTENKHLSLLFIKRNGSTADKRAIRSSALGQKDTGTSSSQVLDRLFKKPPRKRRAPLGDGVAANERYVARIVNDVQTSGEYEKIAQGCFEKYLTARPTNNEALPRILQALDWIYLYDQLDNRLRSEREYELLAYVPYSFVAWYPLFSSQVPNPMYLKRIAHQEAADAFAASVPQHIKTLFSGPNTVAELLPLLNRIVAPDFKPVNSQVVKNEERAPLMRLVNTMISTKLAFVLDKSEDGQLLFKLDPPIDVFVHFDGKRPTDIAPGRYAVRQMVNRDLRRTDQDACEIFSAYKTNPAKAAAHACSPAAEGDSLAIAPPPPKRVRQATHRFNEGFSNAVRVNKKVSDFF
ncbi:chromosome transmission fidelity protein 18 [Rhodotorula toruloides NP11]|uniref:Chromosome transmission fidelity protein 18 n=1 Tax=Rhodotorula toruloides (strain NP11) TaxID=1130832 RepID=M7WFE0_RHOT1|nr:chromosome transmission fidelity protein 18 [Rhodotorula toruloides NP11]EMS19142.1 chromosome transmission fidelity protein 18 [Rhodotorula toruloides NP11]